jgi:outer membrane protein assembly factor BamC
MRRISIKSSMLLMSVLATGLLTSACTSTFSGDTIDYKSAGEKKGPNLTFPPDMTAMGGDKRYMVPDGGATLSSYSTAVKNKPTGKEAVLPAVSGIKIEREGNRRWLVVSKPAKDLYPSVREFWQETGFILLTDSPETGIMETDWAENRAKIPQDIIRRTIGKVFDALYSTGERDKFRTRLEVNSKGETEIYITHRGASEELTGTDKSQVIWTNRPNDPELEAEFLARLMQRLGYTEEAARASVGQKSTVAANAPSRLKKDKQPRLEFAGNFDRAWRDVGVGLDRSNFTVEDRDRNKGLYYVRFVNTKDLSPESKGFFSGWFSKINAEELKKAKRYRVQVKDVAGMVTVTVQDEKGADELGETALQILTLLDQQVGR